MSRGCPLPSSSQWHPEWILCLQEDRERGSADHTELHGDSRGLKVYQKESNKVFLFFAENSCVCVEEPCIYMLTSCAPMLVWLLLCMTLRMSRQFHQSSMILPKTNMAMAMQHHHFLFGDLRYIFKSWFFQCQIWRSQATRLDESVSEMVSHPTPRSGPC